MRGFKSAKKIKKIHESSWPEDIKKDVIGSLISKDYKKTIPVYFWESTTDGVAKQAFLSKGLCLKNWLRTHGNEILGGQESAKMYKVHTPIKKLLSYTKKGEVFDLPFCKEDKTELSVPIPPLKTLKV